MFESNNNEDSSKNVILKRNVSSGGITENEGILPSLRFDVSLISFLVEGVTLIDHVSVRCLFLL